MSCELKVSRLMRSLPEDNPVPPPCHVGLDTSLRSIQQQNISVSIGQLLVG
jgi:hypothetical protein